MLFRLEAIAISAETSHILEAGNGPIEFQLLRSALVCSSGHKGAIPSLGDEYIQYTSHWKVLEAGPGPSVLPNGLN